MVQPVASYTVFINGGRAERPGFEYMKTRLGRPRMIDYSKNGLYKSRFRRGYSYRRRYSGSCFGWKKPFFAKE